MSRLLSAILWCIFVWGCATDAERDSGVPTPPSDKPKQFVPSDREVVVPGCEELKRRTEEHNRLHPNNKLVADC